MQLFKINPELAPFNKDLYTLAATGKDGNYYHRFVGGDLTKEASDYDYFSHKRIKEELIILKKMKITTKQIIS